MRTKPIIRGLAGLGLTAGLFMGCQTFMGQKSDTSSVSDTNAELLRLAVKDSGACVDLKARCVRAHDEGNDSQSLVADLVDSCIVDTAAAHRILDREGREGRGGPHGGRGGFHGPRLDSAARAALCDSLTGALGQADSTDSGYAILKHETHEACEEPGLHGLRPVLDSAAAKALCDSMTTLLAGTDTTSADYRSIRHETAEACEERRPPMSRERGAEGDRGRGRHGRHGHH